MGLKAFLRENAKLPENRRVVISPRFTDDGGKPAEWELRAIGERENALLKEACSDKKLRKGRMVSSFDGSLYTKRLCAACVVYPDLMDSGLQESYGAVGAEKLLEAMLLPGEYASLSEQASLLCGFDPEEAEEEVKNS